MRRLVVLVVFGLMMSRAVATAAADLKIGYIDLQQVLESVDEGKKVKKILEKEFSARSKELESAEDELKQMKADLDRQSLMMTDQAKRDKMSEFQTKLREHQQKAQSAQMELVDKQNEYLKPIEAKLSKVIAELGQSAGYTLIIRKEALLYAPTSVDITHDVVAAYNAKK